MLIYWPSFERFLAPMNLPQPPPPKADDQVAFINLYFVCMNLHKFILCPGPCRVQVGLFLLCVLFLASSSYGLEVCFYPIDLVDEAYWWTPL